MSPEWEKGDTADVMMLDREQSAAAAAVATDEEGGAKCRHCERWFPFSQLSRQGSARHPSYTCSPCRKAVVAWCTTCKARGDATMKAATVQRNANPELHREHLMHIREAGNPMRVSVIRSALCLFKESHKLNTCAVESIDNACFLITKCPKHTEDKFEITIE